MQTTGESCVRPDGPAGGGGGDLERLLGDGSGLAQLLVDRIADYAIFALDRRGFVRSWNLGAERLKGYAPAEILGEHFSRFYSAADREAGLPDSLLVEAERDGVAHHDGWRVRKGGERFWGDVTITALRDDDGQHIGFAKVTRDLTERHEQDEALRRALAREREAAVALDRLDRTRTRFLAAVAHDLSTPITVIRSSVELVLKDLSGAAGGGADLAEATELLLDARRNADDLDQLRAQLQEFSRLEGGTLELDVRPVALGPLVRQVAADTGRASGVAVESDVPADLHVLGDDLALRRVLGNLVGNAARYTPAGRPVRVVTAPGPRSEQVAVGVVDEGPGIAPAEQERVFLDFWSGRGGTRLGGGLGLGLSIVRGYVEQHGGQVWIDSGTGRGATFWFTLDLAAGDGPASQLVDGDDA